jgi:hypothetical protein
VDVQPSGPKVIVDPSNVPPGKAKLHNGRAVAGKLIDHFVTFYRLTEQCLLVGGFHMAPRRNLKNFKNRILFPIGLSNKVATNRCYYCK